MNTNYSAIAQAIYYAYCKQAGGKTFDGKPLPSYAELGADRQACWEAAAREAVAQVAAMRDPASLVRPQDDSVQTSHHHAFITPYPLNTIATPPPVAPHDQSPVVFSSGGGGDFGGAGASGDFGGSSSSDSGASESSSSDSGSSSSSD